ncbi:DUF262 domain-containing protein [Wohlfahrtiimonas populi]|uniref:DUF262 domain-containing protein n=1 Tax=Wohlfahrtiimonas populi TaxID=1940240 RepID=UPI00098D4130|nr:DUF262 domain-containing protein [Wohlfahrtiimonas populi]
MELKSIHTIFKDRILRIPSYQRGYSWGNNKFPTKKDDLKDIKGQLIDLWNDIQNIPDNKWHYTGLLTLVKMENNDPDTALLTNYQQFAIVDGQQRITSILILIAVLIKYAEQYDHYYGIRKEDAGFQYLYITHSTSKACIFGYDQDNPSDKFFKKYVLGLNDLILDDSKESIYTENLLKAYKFFEQAVSFYLEEHDDKKLALTKLFTKVTTNLRLNEYVLPDELDEYVVFETMNNRGKPLSQLEKLKNRLMYLADKLDIAPSIKTSLINSINQSWITIYQSLGANKNNPLDDDAFIKAHWIMYFGKYDRSEANVYSNQLFNDYFTIDQVYAKKITEVEIYNYVLSLQQSSNFWNQIHNVEFIDDPDIKEGLRRLYRVGFRAAFKPLILSTMLQYPSNSVFLDVINALENFSLKVFLITGRQSNTGDSKLFSLAGNLYNKTIDLEYIINKINEFTSEYYNFNLFETWIADLTKSANSYYDWVGLKYLLFEYDNHLRAQNKTNTAISELNWKDFINKKTIEHIYPQSAYESENNLNGDWDAFKDFTLLQKKRFCNSLGNLLPLTNSDNASFNNDPFKYKVDQSKKEDKYINRGYIHDSISAQIIAKEPDWTPEQIKRRGLDMINFLLYKLNEPSTLLTEEEKLKLLGLDFLI